MERNAALRSVTAGIMVGAGSAYETPENNGISHFIEHMQFKGTDKRTAENIVSEFDRAGSVYNAFTGKEYTCYYFKSIDEKVRDCFACLPIYILIPRSTRRNSTANARLLSKK